MVGRLRVKQITNDTDNGAPEFPYGISDPTIPAAPPAQGGIVAFEAQKDYGGPITFTLNATIPTWTRVSVDTLSKFNASTGVYTVGAAGFYFLSSNVSYNQGSGSLATIDWQIRVNGGAIDASTATLYSPNGQWVTGSVSLMVYASIGTTFSLGTYSASSTLSNTYNRYHFCGYRL